MTQERTKQSPNTPVRKTHGWKPWKPPAPKSRLGRLWGRTSLSGKPAWDWLELLIVPLALAVIGFSFTAQQGARQSAIEEQRARDATLQAYLEEMGPLLIEKNLRDSEEFSAVHTLARARTSTVMGQLDAQGNRSVTHFLSEAGLTGAGDSSISLLRGLELANADMEGAFLPYANLSDTTLSSANLSEADLERARLSDAFLDDTDFTGAYLAVADLNNAYLDNADLSNTLLFSANLSNTDLSDADLSDASLVNANLSGAELLDANLGSTSLTAADLSGANLSGAENITNEELEQQAKSLKGAIMPNGQKYEDWLKDRENSGEVGE